ncbi:MAG: hypothetical protein M3Y72_13095, partial [Acidobacteriota bacterium]|nr:hypothetical protein [Acidobacteriota bacterium]
MPLRTLHRTPLSRRELLRGLGATALALRAAPFYGSPLLRAPGSEENLHESRTFAEEPRYRPQYPSSSSLADVLRLVSPGSDAYITELYASQITALFASWSRELSSASPRHSRLSTLLSDRIEASSLTPSHEAVLRDRAGIEVAQRRFAPAVRTTPALFLTELTGWLGPLFAVTVAEFEIFSIDIVSTSPLTVQI